MNFGTVSAITLVLTNNDMTNEYGFDPDEFEDMEEEQFPKYYDLEKVIENQIRPLLTTIINICNEYEIPMVASFQYKNTPSKVRLCTSIVNPPDRTDQRITNAITELLHK